MRKHLRVVREVVEHLGVRARIAEQELLALAMHLDEVLSDFLQVGEIYHIAVDARAALAVLENLASDNELVVTVYSETFDNLLDFRFVADVKNAFDDSLALAGTHHRCLRLVATDHAERLEEYGLACAGFAGNGREPFAERDFCLGNQGKIVYRKSL